MMIKIIVAFNTSGSTGWTCMNQELPKDCGDVKRQGNVDVASGQYIISLQDDGPPFRVYCDMDTDGGGWTVRRLRLLNGRLKVYIIISKNNEFC